MTNTEHPGNERIVKIKDVFGRNCQIAEEQLLGYAHARIESRMLNSDALVSSDLTRQYLRLRLGNYHREMFYVLYLNNQNQVIKQGILFEGTIDQATVHPREVVREALNCNAAAVIFAHNHPSGTAEPSHADISITRRLKSALSLIDIRTLDHFVVGNTVVSLAERGLM